MQPAAAPAAGVPPRHDPRGGPGTSPVAVRAPALEALEAVEAAPEQAAAGGRGPGPTGRRQHRPERPGRARTGRSAGPRHPPEPRRAAEPAPGRPDGPRRHDRPDAEAERELVRKLPVRPADVCALGRRHGRWHPDSPEARICAGVHGG